MAARRSIPILSRAVEQFIVLWHLYPHLRSKHTTPHTTCGRRPIHEKATRHRGGAPCARRRPGDRDRFARGVHPARSDPGFVLTTEEKTHEALLLTRRLLAFAPHCGARGGHSDPAAESEYEGQEHGRRRRFLAGEPARLRSGARARQRRAARRGPGERAVPRRPETRSRPHA